MRKGKTRVSHRVGGKSPFIQIFIESCQQNRNGDGLYMSNHQIVTVTKTLVGITTRPESRKEFGVGKRSILRLLKE